MFWDFDFHNSNALDSVLDKEDVTLQQILDEEDVLQECRNKNKKLVDFLTKEEVFAQLVDTVLTQPDDDDVMQQFKYPQIASEVLTSDVIEIADRLATKQYLSKIWKYFDAEGLLNPLVASFIVKILIFLFSKRRDEFRQHLLDNPSILSKLIAHVETPAVVSLMVALCTQDEDLDRWLCQVEQHFIDDLVAVLDPQAKSSIAELSNLHQFFQEVLVTCRREAMDAPDIESFNTPNPVHSYILRSDTINQILVFAFEHEETEDESLQKAYHRSLFYGVLILLDLISEPTSLDDDTPMSETDHERHKQEVKSVLSVLSPKLSHLHQLIVDPPERASPLLTSSGPLERPIGKLRLTAIHLLVELMRYEDEEITQNVIKLNTIDSCLQFVLDYPENNFLHKYVFDIVIDSIGVGTEEAPASETPLLKHLMSDCRMICRIVSLYQDNQAEEARDGGHRRGFMGFVLKMCQRIIDSKIDISLYTDSEIVEQWNELIATQVQPLLVIAAKPLGGPPPQGFLDDSDSDEFCLVHPNDPSYFGTDFATTGLPAYDVYISSELVPAFPEFGHEFEGTQETKEDVVPSYGIDDGPFSAGLPQGPVVGPMAPMVDWEIGIPDWFAAEGVDDNDDDTFETVSSHSDHDSTSEFVQAEIQTAAAANPVVHVSGEVSGSDNSSDSDDDSNEGMAGSYDLSAAFHAGSMLPETIALSPRSTNAVRHISPADPVASSPVTTPDMSWANFSDLEKESETDEPSPKPSLSEQFDAVSDEQTAELDSSADEPVVDSVEGKQEVAVDGENSTSLDLTAESTSSTPSKQVERASAGSPLGASLAVADDRGTPSPGGTRRRSLPPAPGGKKTPLKSSESP